MPQADKLPAFTPPPTTEYASTAYKPAGVKPMPGLKPVFWDKLGVKIRGGLTYLPWGHYLDRESSIAVGMPPPEPWFLDGFRVRVRAWRLNHRHLHLKRPNFLMWLVYFVLYIYTGVLICEAIMPPVPQRYSLLSLQGIFMLVVGMGLATLLFAPIFYFCSLPPRVIFDRATGMVTFRRFLFPALRIPFTDLDALLQPPCAQAPKFVVAVRARYTAMSVCICNTAGSLGSAYLYWQFLQRFMDVSRPLPDIPNLEPYRRLDPATAAHDARTNRPERLWRDKSRAEIESLAKEMREREEDIEPVWPCALAPFIEGRDPMSAEIVVPK